MTSRNGLLVIRISNAAARWAICATIAVVALVGVIVSGRWAVAETLIYFAKRGPVPLTALERAKSFEPSNPEASFLLGVYFLDVEAPPNLALAEANLTESLALGPNRSDTWLALGRLHEAAGNASMAESAFQRAAVLAPSHWKPVWMLGNLYVRQGRVLEAVEPFQKTIAAYPAMAQIAVRTLWLGSAKDDAVVSRLAEESPAGRGAIVDLMLSEDRTTDAFETWRAAVERFPADKALAERGKALAAAALASGQGEMFTTIWTTLGGGLSPETMANPGFEEEVSERPISPFEWAIGQAREARVALGAGRASGRSLRVDYDSPDGHAFTHATQTLQVVPGRAYELLFWASTKSLVSGSSPSVTVHAGGATPLDAAAPLPTGTTEWAQYRVAFTAPSTGVVTISIARASCGEICPIFGAAMFDDFEIRAVDRG